MSFCETGRCIDIPHLSLLSFFSYTKACDRVQGHLGSAADKHDRRQNKVGRSSLGFSTRRSADPFPCRVGVIPTNVTAFADWDVVRLKTLDSAVTQELSWLCYTITGIFDTRSLLASIS